MKSDRVTLELKGTVPLDIFATAMSAFSALIEALTIEVTGGAKVEWVVEELQGGSAYAAFVGQSDDFTAVQEVVRAYGIVGSSLKKGDAIPYSDEVRREVFRITEVMNGKVNAISMQDFTIGGEMEYVVPTLNASKTTVALGAVEGVVQTLSSRNKLRFTLYDSLNDRAVYCYLAPAQHDIMREVWDKRAVIEGLITREIQTGRPLEIPQITSVEPAITRSDYKRARGVLSGLVKVDELPEVTVRRSRDAE